MSQKIAAVGPQGCQAGVPYAGVRHYGDGVEKSEANTFFSAEMWLTPPPLAHSGSAIAG